MRIKRKLFPLFAFIAIILVTGCAHFHPFDPRNKVAADVDPNADAMEQRRRAIGIARIMFNAAMKADDNLQPELMQGLIVFLDYHDLDPSHITYALTMDMLRALANPPRYEPTTKPTIFLVLS